MEWHCEWFRWILCFLNNLRNHNVAYAFWASSSKLFNLVHVMPQLKYSGVLTKYCFFAEDLHATKAMGKIGLSQLPVGRHLRQNSFLTVLDSAVSSIHGCWSTLNWLIMNLNEPYQIQIHFVPYTINYTFDHYSKFLVSSRRNALASYCYRRNNNEENVIKEQFMPMKVHFVLICTCQPIVCLYHTTDIVTASTLYLIPYWFCLFLSHDNAFAVSMSFCLPCPPFTTT